MHTSEIPIQLQRGGGGGVIILQASLCNCVMAQKPELSTSHVSHLWLVYDCNTPSNLEGGTPLYGLNGDVWPERVWFSEGFVLNGASSSSIFVFLTGYRYTTFEFCVIEQNRENQRVLGLKQGQGSSAPATLPYQSIC